jgi:hypothetical protein
MHSPPSNTAKAYWSEAASPSLRPLRGARSAAGYPCTGSRCHGVPEHPDPVLGICSAIVVNWSACLTGARRSDERDFRAPRRSVAGQHPLDESQSSGIEESQPGKSVALRGRAASRRGMSVRLMDVTLSAWVLDRVPQLRAGADGSGRRRPTHRGEVSLERSSSNPGFG